MMGIRVLYGYRPGDIVTLPPVGQSVFFMELVAVTAGAGWWVGSRKARQQVVLHGLLVGVSTVVLYEILTVGAPIPRLTWSHIATHMVKIAGGWLGGWLAARQSVRLAAVRTSLG